MVKFFGKRFIKVLKREILGSLHRIGLKKQLSIVKTVEMK